MRFTSYPGGCRGGPASLERGKESLSPLTLGNRVYYYFLLLLHKYIFGLKNNGCND